MNKCWKDGRFIGSNHLFQYIYLKTSINFFSRSKITGNTILKNIRA